MVHISHFTCMVIGGDVEEQLAPYDENISVEPYKAYWDSGELEHWEKILQEPTRSERAPGAKVDDPPVVVTLPPEQVLDEEYTLEDMRRVYIARYFDGDDSPYTGDPEDERPQIDGGGIFEWSTYRQQSKWDWYEVGGRWTGYFKLKGGAEAEVGNPGLMTSEAPEGFGDIAHKGDIDIEGMRDEAGRKAGDVWDRVHEEIAHLDEALGWEEHFVGRLKLTDAGEDEYTIDQARKDYNAQPRVVRLREWNDSLPDGEKVIGFFGPGVEDFQVAREEFVQEARDNRLCPYAYVMNGEWHAPGKMGWFGSSSDTKKDQRRFAREFNALLDSLPDDTLLTLCDLHI